MLLDLLAKLVC